MIELAVLFKRPYRFQQKCGFPEYTCCWSPPKFEFEYRHTYAGDGHGPIALAELAEKTDANNKPRTANGSNARPRLLKRTLPILFVVLNITPPFMLTFC